MYYLYLPYVLILGIVFFVYFIRNKYPVSWALVILAAPVTVPYYILKTKREKGVVYVMIFLSTFSAVAAGEVILYSMKKEEMKYVGMPPIKRQMVRLTQDLKTSTRKLDQAVLELEEMSKVESSIDKIKETIDHIGYVRLLLEKNKETISMLVEYAKNYSGYFEQKNINWVSKIDEYYKSPAVVKHHQTLETYLNEFEDLLRFAFRNFYELTELKQPKARKNYDQYYLEYRRAVDRHNKYNVRRIEFQNRFLEKNPSLKTYLPGKRQTDSFRIWG